MTSEILTGVNAGKIAHTATVEFNSRTYTDVKTTLSSTGDQHLAIGTWSSDEESHWHVCADCGDQMDVNIHSGGTATCSQRAVCSECGVSYGELAPHDFLETWSHGDENGHWHQCKNCNAHDTQVNHVPGPEATENASQRCTICGYILRTPLGLDWFTDGMQDPNSYLWASGYYAKIMEQYGVYQSNTSQ